MRQRMTVTARKKLIGNRYQLAASAADRALTEEEKRLGPGQRRAIEIAKDRLEEEYGAFLHFANWLIANRGNKEIAVAASRPYMKEGLTRQIGAIGASAQLIYSLIEDWEGGAQ